MAEFQTPDFLLQHSTNEIHQRMKDVLPADLDVSSGSHAWNFTRVAAVVAAELCEFVLPEVIKLIFPEYSYGTYLDNHAKNRGISRRAATYATGEITITGEVNVEIPIGSMFSTASVNEEPSVSYITTEAAKIPESGTVTVPIQCTEAGIVGNAIANTIIFVSSRVQGITSVTNAEEVTGGTEEESDDSLIERIVEYDQTQGESFVGCLADYKRWALSVPGVGEANPIGATDDSGIVKIILTDANGDPATEKLCTDVYNYIMKPDETGARLAPVNALLSVVPPTTIQISITATVEVKSDSTLDAVTDGFITALLAYLPTAMAEKEIKYTQIHAVLASVAGVNDFSGLTIGVAGSAEGTANIPVTNTQLPQITEENLHLTSGTV